MGEIINFKNISNWDEFFYMTREYLSFLLEDTDINPDIIIKTTHSIFLNAGYGYTLEFIEEKYYSMI